MADNLPEGFNGVYRCKHHPEREVADPMALRLCDECMAAARAGYADEWRRNPPPSWREMSTDSRDIQRTNDQQQKFKDERKRTSG
jgi:hypothetical protein